MDGRELAARFRANPQTRDAVMIAISGYGQQQEISKSLDAGFDHHLTKPIEFEALERLLENPPRRASVGRA
jgi:CheY-like chemotaxis protein